jgi:hypothetical protein
MQSAGNILLLALLITGGGSSRIAPLQCGSRDQDPALRREDTAGDGLWALAETFGKEGNQAGRTRTLRFLATRYPSHRFASQARQEACPTEAECPVAVPEPRKPREKGEKGAAGEPSASATVSE